MPDNINPTMPQSRRQSVAVEALTPIAVPVKVAGQMLGLGKTSVHQLLKTGELQSYAHGGARRILTSSINDFVARRLAASPKSAQRGPKRPRKIDRT